MSKELTEEAKMQIAIAKRREERKIVKDNAKLALLENEKYIDYLAMTEEEEETISSLTAVIDMLNRIPAEVSKDGTKYGVNIFPVAEYIFGPAASRMLGIIGGVSSMFTEDRQTKFEAITGVSYLKASKASNAIGEPAFYSKGKYSPTVPGIEDQLEIAMTAVAQSLKIDLEYLQSVNTANIARWFKIADDKATKQYNDFKQTEKIDAGNNFVLED